FLFGSGDSSWVSSTSTSSSSASFFLGGGGGGLGGEGDTRTAVSFLGGAGAAGGAILTTLTAGAIVAVRAGGATGAAILLGAERSPMDARCGIAIGPTRRFVPSSILLTDAVVRSSAAGATWTSTSVRARVSSIAATMH